LNKAWTVYLLECVNGAFYTGITTDMVRRLLQHQTGKGARYTRMNGVKRLCWTESAADRSAALKREAQIKKWPRLRKQKLGHPPA
jgi:putative endonuclease